MTRFVTVCCDQKLCQECSHRVDICPYCRNRENFLKYCKVREKLKKLSKYEKLEKSQKETNELIGRLSKNIDHYEKQKKDEEKRLNDAMEHFNYICVAIKKELNKSEYEKNYDKVMEELDTEYWGKTYPYPKLKRMGFLAIVEYGINRTNPLLHNRTLERMRETKRWYCIEKYSEKDLNV
jgi:hypothetical protein